jgi:PAT family acetyl-CoA transporter-like MFS transporter 1
LQQGLLTLSAFLFFWGVIFVVTTFGVWALKQERGDGEALTGGALSTAYKEIIAVARLPAVRELAFLLLTCRIAFAAVDSITQLKLVENGLPRDKLAFLSVALSKHRELPFTCDFRSPCSLCATNSHYTQAPRAFIYM